MRRYAALLLVPVLVLCGAAAARPEVLPNGGFEHGLAGWGLSQQEAVRAELAAVPGDSPTGGKAARVRITVNGPAHRLQLSHEFRTDALQPGKGYILRFDAKADRPTAFQVVLMNRNRPWENLGLSRPVALGAVWKTFRFPFRARKSEQELGKVNFMLGQAQGTVWLDGLAIEPYDPRSAAVDGPELSTRDWSLQFFKTGAIARLAHTATGRVLVEPSEDRLAYEITFSKVGESQVETSAGARAIRGEALEGKRGYRFVADHARATVTMDYCVDPGTGLIECRAAVQNRSDAAVTRLVFPIVDAPETLGAKSDDDLILYPAFDGCVIDNPCEVFRRRQGKLSHDYPGPLSCQVMAFCDPTAGLYLGCHDPGGFPKTFAVEPGFRLRFSIAHLGPEQPGKDLQPSYPVLVGPLAGDPRRGGTSWHDAAEIYRTWSQKQKWAELKVRTRKDTPEWLRAGALVTFYDPRRITPPGDQTRLEAFLADYGARFNTPILPNNRGFERWGTWCGQEYRPVMPDEATFHGSARTARELGGRSMIMLSGYRWTIERTSPEGEHHSNQERFDRELARWMVQDAAGRAVVSTSTRKNDYRGQRWARMCRATDFAKDTIVDFAKYCVRNGYSVIHFDQECSGAYAASVCRAKGHGHAPGDGPWVHLAMADLYQRLCDACRPLDPDFMLSMEEPNELYLPWLNMAQSRPFGITTEWPCVPPCTRTVPLFLYLYHENLIGWAAFYPWKSAGHPCYTLAKGFAAGLMPGLVPPQNLGMKGEALDRFLTLFTRCMAGTRTFAHDYLVWGRMQRPLALEIPARRFSQAAKGEIIVPAVSHQVWSLEDGRVGVVFVNPAPQPFELDADFAPLWTGAKPCLVREASTQGGRRTHASARFHLTIPGLDMLLVELSGK